MNVAIVNFTSSFKFECLEMIVFSFDFVFSHFIWLDYIWLSLECDGYTNGQTYFWIQPLNICPGPNVLSLKIFHWVDESEYQKRIVPCIVKLFASTDRVTRSRLLQQLDSFINHFQPQVVNDQIFPQVAHGFLDTNPTIREQTVKVNNFN